MSAVVYEVSADVDAAIGDEYLHWLGPHVAEILALPGFTRAEVFEVVDPASPDMLRVCMRYHLADEAALQAYLREHAPRLRADGIVRFGDRMRAQRRVMRALDLVR